MSRRWRAITPPVRGSTSRRKSFGLLGRSEKEGVYDDKELDEEEKPSLFLEFSQICFLPQKESNIKYLN